MPIFRIHMDGKGGEHNYASNRTKHMRSILARTSHLPGTDPQKENQSRTSHTPVYKLHQTHETDLQGARPSGCERGGATSPSSSSADQAPWCPDPSKTIMCSRTRFLILQDESRNSLVVPAGERGSLISSGATPRSRRAPSPY